MIRLFSRFLREKEKTRVFAKDLRAENVLKITKMTQMLSLKTRIMGPYYRLFYNELFFRKFGSRSSLTRTSHRFRSQKTRARPNTIFPRSTQHYSLLVFRLRAKSAPGFKWGGASSCNWRAAKQAGTADCTSAPKFKWEKWRERHNLDVGLSQSGWVIQRSTADHILARLAEITKTTAWGHLVVGSILIRLDTVENSKMTSKTHLTVKRTSNRTSKTQV
jgi:hypothetical protein